MAPTNVDGLFELESGWWLAIAAVGQGQVRVVIQFDPDGEMRLAGSKVVMLTAEESRTIGDAFDLAACRSEGRVP